MSKSESPPSKSVGREAGEGRRPRALLVDDARFDKHASPAYHPERPERLVAARSAISAAEVAWQPVAAREATADELIRVHDARFVEGLERLRGEEGFLDPDTYIAKDSISAARVAAGGIVEMIDALIDGPVKKGVALPRPPGHHARPSRAMGFCLLNNVAVAAAHARFRGLKRVVIVDWDVHHGNGTQEMFLRDPHVLYVSLHQFPFYPGSGAAHETGEGDGRGYTVNVPVSAHGDDAVYQGAFDRIILPILDAYAPELVLVSAGFDASARDPLAQMELSAGAFQRMSASLRRVAKKHAKGRMALVLEGGYDLVALDTGLQAAIHGMTAPVRAPRATKAPSARPAKASSHVDHPDVARAAREARSAWPVVS